MAIRLVMNSKSAPPAIVLSVSVIPIPTTVNGGANAAAIDPPGSKEETFLRHRAEANPTPRSTKAGRLRVKISLVGSAPDTISAIIGITMVSSLPIKPIIRSNYILTLRPQNRRKPWLPIRDVATGPAGSQKAPLPRRLYPQKQGRTRRDSGTVAQSVLPPILRYD